MKEKRSKPDCVICKKKDAAYKCPKCRAAYCSKDCCQEHKNTGCNFNPSNSSGPSGPSASSAPLSSTLISEITPPDFIPAVPVTEPTVLVSKKEDQQLEDTITPDDPRYIVLSETQKEALRNSTELKELFRSKRLRDDFEKVDNATDRRVMLKKMRDHNAEFNQVVELMLKVISYDINQ